MTTKERPHLGSVSSRRFAACIKVAVAFIVVVFIISAFFISSDRGLSDYGHLRSVVDDLVCSDAFVLSETARSAEGYLQDHENFRQTVRNGGYSVVVCSQDELALSNYHEYVVIAFGRYVGHDAIILNDHLGGGEILYMNGPDVEYSYEEYRFEYGKRLLIVIGVE